MPVNYTSPAPEQLFPVTGVRLGTAGAAIKNWTRDDIVLVALEPGAHAAGVFTQNRFSTGVIMERLPVTKIIASLPQCHASLTSSGWHAAARAIMTTDTVPKGASRRVDVEGVGVTVTGIAKGAGMMSPNMATMLGFVATDAPIAGRLLADLVTDVADASFNRITVDGDTSTNDSFVVISSGKAPIDPIAREDDPRLVVVRETI